MAVMRYATREDIPAINDIVNYYIRETCINWSWEERPLEDAYAWLEGHKLPRHPVYVIEEDGQILAFGSLSPFRPKEGYWPVVENSVYARPECKGRGFGTMLMRQLIDDAKAAGLWAITAWITDDNTDSIRFHEKLGFAHTGIMPGVGEKWGRRLGVVIMQMDLTEGTDEQRICG